MKKIFNIIISIVGIIISALLLWSLKQWLKSEDTRSLLQPYAQFIDTFFGPLFGLIKPLILPVAIIGNLWLIYYFTKMIFFGESKIHSEKPDDFDRTTIFLFIFPTLFFVLAGTFYEKRHFEQEGNLLVLNLVLAVSILAITFYYRIVETIIYKFRVIKADVELKESLNEDLIQHSKEFRKQSEIMILIIAFGLFNLICEAAPYINNFSAIDMAIDCTLSVIFWLILPSYFIIRKYVVTSRNFYITIPIIINGLLFTYVFTVDIVDGFARLTNIFNWLQYVGVSMQLILTVYLYRLSSKK